MTTLQDIHQHLDGELHGDPSIVISGLAAIETSEAGCLSFVFERLTLEDARQSKASAFVSVKPLDGLPHILVKDGRKALADCLDLFYPPTRQIDPGVHPTAIVEGAYVDPSACIGPYCVIGKGSRIGRAVQLGSHVSLGKDCEIGDDATLADRVTLYDGVSIGKRTLVHSGAVIGADGFGFTAGDGQLRKIQHVASVAIGDDVEIGANTTIDRGCLQDTVIGRGCKIDNLVQVGHNVKLGDHSVVTAQVGIGGSADIGQWCQIGGQAAISNIKIGDGVRIGAKAGVTRDVADHETVSGFPATDHRLALKQQAVLRRLARKGA